MVGLKQFEKYSLYSINVVSQFDQLLHFKTRLIASGVPLMIPYFSITSTEYSEQVGENLHPPPPNIYSTRRNQGGFLAKFVNGT